MMQQFVFRTNLNYYLLFCMERKIMPTVDNSALWLKHIMGNYKFDNIYYEEFKLLMKRVLDKSDFNYFEFSLQ